MNKHLPIIAAMVFAASTLPVAALEGNGTAESPYLISTPEDLKAIASVDRTDYSYFMLMNDIDMANTPWTPLFPKEANLGKVHFDGRGHVISNLSFSGSYASLFGNVDGSVKNLGLVDFAFYGPGDWDPSGAFAAYAGFNDVFTVEGCFAIGTVTGYYAGGIIGGTKYGATITNCYTVVNAAAIGARGGLAGGVCATLNYSQDRDVTLTVNNCFVEGDVIAINNAAGLLGGNQTYLHPAGTKEVFNVTNAVVFSPSINCAIAADAIACTSSVPPIELNAENVYVYEETKVNDVNVTDGVSYEVAMAEVLSWPAFTINDEGELCLKWEIEGVSGVNDVVVNEATDAPAVYYNLQGVEVNNPANGVYIVRRGNKTYKALVK